MANLTGIQDDHQKRSSLYDAGLLASSELTKKQPTDTETMEEKQTNASDQPAITKDQQAYVAAYLSTVDTKRLDFDRLVTERSGLTHEEMHNIFAHPDLGGRGLEVLVDSMKPEGSMYFDAIFGPNYGQRDIRHWLLPTMLENSFLQFRPTGPSIFMDDGEGGTSMDEWVMVAAMEDEEIFLGNGISVRRFRDGWMVDAIDVYDSAISRTPPPPEMVDPNAPPPPELPPYPVMNFKAVAEPPWAPISDAARPGWRSAKPVMLPEVIPGTRSLAV